MFGSQPQFCNRIPTPRPPDNPLVTSFVHVATGNEDRRQAARARGLDVPQMGPPRSSVEFPCGDSQTGQKPTSLSLPLGPLLFASHAHKAPSTFKCQLCIDLFPALKRDLFLFEVFVGPLLLLFKNYLHEGKRARFLGMQMNIYLIHK